ncbi:dihydroorotase [Salmonirosea aquatica]|uniref:Amidohydrolase family protein n=1 Tax=Salmonirosea aquatica TaxID=2654236 RepID=A0A7C9BBX5_9BACT|nr:amidohydrolase family protein [Cytophagaceae bacterium SJW1-29]
MKILVRSVRIMDKTSPLDGQVRDILIEEGRIAQIGESLTANEAQVVEADHWCVSPGWLDLRVASRDPGFEHKEDLDSVREAALRGGFTEIVLLPNSSPVVDAKDTLNYVRRPLGGPVRVHVTAAVTRKAEGTDFTEMIDLHRAGAVAFTDGENPIQNADILLKALLYLRPLNALLINRPEDRQLTLYGQMNEGVTSTLLGMKGMPALAEEMMLSRDLKLLAYALEQAVLPQDHSHSDTLPMLHVSLVSTARAVALIREAKAAGLPVSCDVAAHQLVFDDSALLGFDTNLKVNPPFRTPADREALRQGLADGTIDCLVSDHSPHDEECKNLEFDHADFGITGLETAFSLSLMHSGLPVEDIIEKLTSRPRRILRLPVANIIEGQPANLTFFAPDLAWRYEKTASLSKNTPFLGQNLTGKVMGVINDGHARWFV